MPSVGISPLLRRSQDEVGYFDVATYIFNGDLRMLTMPLIEPTSRNATRGKWIGRDSPIAVGTFLQCLANSDILRSLIC